ncbi:MAG: hypothetical protein WC175_04775 [Candidatus Dojkabacteria bacterium]
MEKKPDNTVKRLSSDKVDEKYMYNMKINETIRVDPPGGDSFTIIRTIGGWIYKFYGTYGWHSVFVNDLQH